MKQKKSAEFPADVLAAVHDLEHANNQSHLRLIRQLTKPGNEEMWKALERRKSGNDRLWVHAFLAAVEFAMALPPYYSLSGRKKRSLCNRITALSGELAGLYSKNDLGVHLVKLDAVMWSGFYAFEDFSDSFRRQIEVAGDQKLSVIKIIETLAKRAVARIRAASARGKAGRNVRAVQFVRELAERNIHRYGKPLNGVIATATNALFDTQYGESDVRKLLSRYLGNQPLSSA